MSILDEPRFVSKTKVSDPLPPASVSLPPPPFRLLLPLLPVRLLTALLPVPLIAEEPVRTRFSRFAPSVKVTEDRTVSVPWPEFSVIVSPPSVT